MGDWAVEESLELSPSAADVEARSDALRKETEATIAMLRAIHDTAKGHLTANAQLTSKFPIPISSLFEVELVKEQKVNGHECRARAEEKKAEEARVALASATEEVNALKVDIAQKEEAVASLEAKAAEAAGQLEKTLAEKDAELARLQKLYDDQESLMTGIKYLRGNIDAFHVGAGLLKEPNGALMLPDGCLVVADHHLGLLKFSPNTELLCSSSSPDWKWPQGLAYDKTRDLLVVSLAKKAEEEGERFERAIAEFTPQLELLRSSPGPPQASFEHVAKERLAIGKKGDLYLSLADNTSSSLYKRSLDEWKLLTGRPGAYFADVALLGQTGPIAEVLVSETNMGYIYKLAVRNFDVADRRSIAVVEKPGAIAVDENGQLFCQDTISGKIRMVDTRRWEATGDVAVLDEAVFAMTAGSGFLGVAGRETKSVRVFRYSNDAVRLDVDV